MADCEDFDSRARRPEHDRKREVIHRSAANRSSSLAWEATRRFFDLSQRVANRRDVAGPQTGLPGLVPSDLIQVLGFSPRVELQRHFRSARALASTSSAGTSETSPRSIWSARRAASCCHSSSTSSDRGVSRLSNNWRTSRARSSTGRFSASSAMAFKSTPQD